MNNMENDRAETIIPAFVPAACVVPVVFASDDSYAPLLGVALASLVRHASPARRYDIVILERGLSELNRRRLRSLARDNVSVRFFDVSERVHRQAPDLFISRHLSEATYYRMFMPDILPDYAKALYLDCDIVLQADAAGLFDLDIGHNLVGAVPSAAMAYNLQHEEKAGKPVPWEGQHDGWRNYLTGVVEMRDPYQYLQCGVLVLNLDLMRRERFLDQCLALIRRMRSPVFHDQDTFSSVCEGKVAWLGLEWNFTWEYGFNTAATPEAFAAGLPPALRDAYAGARDSVKIIHYCSDRKPWTHPDVDYADAFWDCARETPFYEEMLARLMRRTAEDAVLAAARDADSAVPALIKANRTVEERHRRAFPAYKNAHAGREVAVVATGPSLAKYRPIPDAVHIGVNRAFQRREVELDFLFVQHFPGIDDLTEQLVAYGAGKVKKFYGVISEQDTLRWRRPDAAAGAAGFELYYCLNGPSGGAAHFAAEIERLPMSANGSVVFAALQFALYTGPKRIYLVGCDSTGKGTAASADGGLSDADRLVRDWEQLRDFAAENYPGIEIVSVNPVRLAGMFRDIVQ